MGDGGGGGGGEPVQQEPPITVRDGRLALAWLQLRLRVLGMLDIGVHNHPLPPLAAGRGTGACGHQACGQGGQRGSERGGRDKEQARVPLSTIK